MDVIALGLESTDTQIRHSCATAKDDRPCRRWVTRSGEYRLGR